MGGVKFGLEKMGEGERKSFSLEASAEKRERAAPKKQERSLAKQVKGGKRQPLSGARSEAKGDVKIEHQELRFLVDCKHTKHASITVTEGWLKKITEEALAAQAHPLMELEIGGAESLSQSRWVLMPTNLFALLLEMSGQQWPSDLK
jgi:Holliday junction resolvase